MPAAFSDCAAKGGRIRTVNPKRGSYLHVCYDKSGKSHAGEVKKTKTARKPYLES